MKAVLISIALLGVTAAAGLAAPVGEATAAPGPLPASLDRLYPPQAPPPLGLIAMVEMGTSFAGMVGDFFEGDFANAEQGYANFRRQYGEYAAQVPEWQGDLPTAPIEALGEALLSRDPARFGPAVEAAGGVCHACHVKSMTAVQHRYHWGDFHEIVLRDPVSKGDLPFTAFMQMLEGDLAGVQVDLAQGQLPQAREHAAGLAARYGALGDACVACHSSERKYFVDASVTGMLEQLGAALGADAPDAAGVRKLVQGIGMESCHACHLVHAPAALARYAGK